LYVLNPAKIRKDRRPQLSKAIVQTDTTTENVFADNELKY